MDSKRKLLLETKAAATLRNLLLELTDDKETIRDTVEGEVDLKTAIHGALLSNIEDEAFISGIEATITNLKSRLNRLKFRAETREKAIFTAMQVGEIQKVELPEATISLRRVPPGLDVTDEKLIPKEYWIPQEPKLDRKKLKDDLKAGKSVAGAVLDNGSISLSIRRG